MYSAGNFTAICTESSFYHRSVPGIESQVISDLFVDPFVIESALIQSKTKSNPFPSKGDLTVVHKFVGISRNQACLGKEKP